MFTLYTSACDFMAYLIRYCYFHWSTSDPHSAPLVFLLKEASVWVDTESPVDTLAVQYQYAYKVFVKLTDVWCTLKAKLI